MGIYQLAKMNSVPEYAAVNESVVLAKRFAKGREGFINGVLRGYINEKYTIKLPGQSRRRSSLSVCEIFIRTMDNPAVAREL